jgi:hypothetical protein
MHKVASEALFGKQAEFPSVLLAGRGWTLLSKEFPTLEVLFTEAGRPPLRVKLHCRDWNEQPPAIQLLNSDAQLLASIPRDPGGVFNPSAHPVTGRPFICMRGSREYHTHPSHMNDPWDQLRGKSAYDLGGILTQVWRAWQKAKP